MTKINHKKPCQDSLELVKNYESSIQLQEVHCWSQGYMGVPDEPEFDVR